MLSWYNLRLHLRWSWVDGSLPSTVTTNGGRITSLKSSVENTNRKLACRGESITFLCTSNGTGLIWDSHPSIGQNENSNNMFTFVENDPVGMHYCYFRNYTNGTAFFASAVLETNCQRTSECKSSMTITPLANSEGDFPQFDGTGGLNITCNVSSGTENDGRTWYYRVAGIMGNHSADCSVCH